VVDPALAPRLEPLLLDATARPDLIALEAGIPGIPTYEELLESAPESPVADWQGDLDVAEIFFTSGTTGRAKGVMLSHRNLYLHALQVIAATGLRDDTVEVVGNVPFFHVNGWGAVHYLVALGATAVILPRFRPEDFAAKVEEEKATFALMVPTMLRDILASGLHRTRDLSSLRLILVGGDRSSPSLLAEARERLGCEVRAGYGLTEASPVVAIADIPHHRRPGREAADAAERLAAAGLPVPGVDVALLGADGSFLPHDGAHVGELLVRGDSVFLGYWQDEEATRAAFHEGWLRTGDLATIDAEGVIRLVGRQKDILVSGGENVSLLEVEEALLAHPAVAECAVVGKPDPRLGEVPLAFVVPRRQDLLDPEELRAFLGARLAPFKVPAEVRFLAALPRTATGKVRRADLLALLGGTSEMPER